MAQVTRTFPYEFLCRWDEKTGKFKAYHFKTITTVMDGANVLACGESGAMTAAQAKAAGFDTSDILDTMHTDALTAVDDEKLALAQALTDAANAHTQAIEALSAKHAEEVAKLQKAVSDANKTIAALKEDAKAPA